MGVTYRCWQSEKMVGYEHSKMVITSHLKPTILQGEERVGLGGERLIG